MPSAVTNSVVAVQIKTMGLSPRIATDPVGVNLEREATRFACLRRDRKYFHLTVSRGDDRWTPGAGTERTIDYDTYDSYHRFGRRFSESDTILSDEFHIFYDNGNGGGCRHPVRSDDEHRARLFLMHSREIASGLPEALTNRFGLAPYLERVPYVSDWLLPNRQALKAGRARMTQYTQLRMLLANYQKKKNAPGCFSFEVTAPTSQGELQISFSDLEEAQSEAMPKFFQQTVWTVGVR